MHRLLGVAINEEPTLPTPALTQIHPTCIPVSGDYQSKLTLMSESLRNDGRIWVPLKANDHRVTAEILKPNGTFFRAQISKLWQPSTSGYCFSQCQRSLWCWSWVGGNRRAVYLDLRDGLTQQGAKTFGDRYSNLLEMYQKITGESAYQCRWKSIQPFIMWWGPMGRLWLMTTIPGLLRSRSEIFWSWGQRLGASALCKD